MANHVPTGAAGGALRGGMLGGVLGFLTIPAMAAGVVALSAFGLGIAGPAIASAAGITAIATTVVGALPITPFNWGMAAYGAAGGGLFGAASGTEKGMQQNVQEQARGAYVNAYAQTRAGIDQMAMAQSAAMPEMAFNTDNTAYHPAMAANQNNAPTLQINASEATHMGKQQSAALAAGEEQGR